MTVLYHIEKKILMMQFLRESQEIAKKIKTEQNYYASIGLMLKASLLVACLKQALEKLNSLNYRVLFKKGGRVNKSLQTIKFTQGEFVIPFADETKKLFPEAKHSTLNIYMQDRINTDKDLINKLRDKIRGMQK